jgi:hypothetical protein
LDFESCGNWILTFKVDEFEVPNESSIIADANKDDDANNEEQDIVGMPADPWSSFKVVI